MIAPAPVMPRVPSSGALRGAHVPAIGEPPTVAAALEKAAERSMMLGLPVVAASLGRLAGVTWATLVPGKEIAVYARVQADECLAHARRILDIAQTLRDIADRADGGENG